MRQPTGDRGSELRAIGPLRADVPVTDARGTRARPVGEAAAAAGVSAGPERPVPSSLGLSGHRIEVRAIAWWALRSLIGIVIAAGLLIAGRFTALPAALLVSAAVLLGLAGVVLVVVEPLWRYRVHRWQATNTTVYAVTGWLVVEWRVAPLTRVQTVDTVRGPLEQLFGLATLRVTTASAAGPIEVPGLDRAVAVAAAEALTEVTEQTRGDAT